jgi:hypothetical protein
LTQGMENPIYTFATPTIISKDSRWPSPVKMIVDALKYIKDKISM